MNGLTGFGTGLTAMGVWLYTISPPVAASLAIVCAVVSQLQTLPTIWHAIEWKRVAPFVLPGLVGAPIGTLLVSHVDSKIFKVGVGLFLIIYSAYALVRKAQKNGLRGGRIADGAVGFGGGVLAGLAGLSGPPVIVWTDIQGYTKHHRRSVLQTFNLAILFAALVAHAFSGLLTKEVGLAAMVALPGTVCGAWLGSRVYKRLGDHGFQRIILVLLCLSGIMLVWTSR